MDCPIKGGTEKWKRHANPVYNADKECERRRSALSASERIGDSTKHDQAGDGDPIYRRSDSESRDGREILAALADVRRDKIYSHPNTELCDGWSLVAAVALHSRQYGLKLRRLQHSVQHTFEQTRDPSRKSTAWYPTAALEQSRERIRSISQDVHALNKRCCVEMATSSAQLAPRRSAVRLRAPERRMTRTTQKRRRRKPRRRRNEPVATQLRSQFQSTKSTRGGSALGIAKTPHILASISTSLLSDRTILVPTRLGTKRALPFISPSPAAFGSSLGSVMVLVDPRLCWLR